MTVVTILMPCLNEAETIERCVVEAKTAAERAELDFEILIADNGSSDGSQQLATMAGARLVSVPERGYGAALMHGIASAKGDYVVFGDCDCSYDFSHVPRFVEELQSGRDLVMGNRFRGGIQDGAMPWLHRYLGNPVLSFIGRLFFRAPVGDFHCGLRGIRKSAFESIPLVTPGMEFASEMVVKSSVNGLRISEIPTILRPDGRSRPPHLRTWRDGWRHLRFMLLFSPEWLFFAPAVCLFVLSLLIGIRLMLGPVVISGVRFDIHTMILMATAVVASIQLALTAVFARALSTDLGVLPPTDGLENVRRWLSVEKGLLAGVGLIVAGAAWVARLVYQWSLADFGDLNTDVTLRELIPAICLLLVGMQISFGSFFLGLLRITRHRTYVSRSDSIKSEAHLPG